MAVAAFWIALAAVLIAGTWRKKGVEQMRHETVRMLIERGRELDEEEIRNLLNPPHPPLPPGHPWLRRSEPNAYRGLRVGGTICMIGSVGLGAMIAGIGMAQGTPEAAAAAGIGVGVFAFLVGVALFVASRFVAKPRDAEPDGDRDM